MIGAAEHRCHRPTLASGLPHVFADAHQIQQVLLNLMINAEQAMLAANGRGALIVRTRHDDERDAVDLEVARRWSGRPERRADAESSTRSSRRRKLAKAPASASRSPTRSCRNMAGAFACVRRRRGRDVLSWNFRISGADAALEAARQHAARRWMRFAARRVLIVEDERALAAAVAEALTDAGLEVDHAGDGEEALACVRNSDL